MNISTLGNYYNIVRFLNNCNTNFKSIKFPLRMCIDDLCVMAQRCQPLNVQVHIDV